MVRKLSGTGQAPVLDPSQKAHRTLVERAVIVARAILLERQYAYLKATLEAIAKSHPAARIDELMPWNFDKQA